MYARPRAPEFASRKPYSPFKLDVWQLGNNIWDFKVASTFHSLSSLDMTNADPGHRLGAKDALDRLRAVVSAVKPESLLIKPGVLDDHDHD